MPLTVFNTTNVTAPQYRMLVDVFMAHEGSTATTLPNSDPSYLGHGSNGSGASYQGLFPNPPSTAAGSPGNIWMTYSMTDTAIVPM